MSAPAALSPASSPAASPPAEGATAPAWRRLLKRLRPVHLGAVAGVVFAVGAGLYIARPASAPTPAERLQAALVHLDDSEYGRAQRIAEKLQDEGYRDAEFPGGVAYVLGMAAFREAYERADSEHDPRFLTAANHLRDAERLSLPAERRAEWAFAAGICLHHTGVTDEAIPTLEEAVRNYPPGRHQASMLLTQVYLDGRTRRDMEKALEVNTELLKDGTLTSGDRDRALIQRAEIMLALDRPQELQEALAKILHEGLRHQGKTVLEARSAMSRGRHRDALQHLEPLSRDVGLERAFPAQATYLMGVCSEELGEYENAVGFYQRTAERFDDTHEALAARLGAASSLRKLGRNEEALELYAQVMRSLRRPGNFHNRWVSAARMTELLLEAWNTWVESHFFEEAIALAEMAGAALPREQALELAARACEQWARRVEADVAALPVDRQPARRPEVEFRWRQSGKAWGRLAENHHSSSAYLKSLWTSAEHYFLGHDFESAASRLGVFIETRTSRLLPAALVKRGQCHMNLGHWEEAIRDFQRVIEVGPADPAAFQARYLIGQCHVERNESDQAERVWRGILDSGELSPTALEWRRALYSLGKLLFETAEVARRKSGLPSGEAANPDPGGELSAAMARFDEAIIRLEEFRDRYPTAPEAMEIRFLLARALQRSAELPQVRWQTAETDNARAEYRRQMHERLDRALREFLPLQAQLLARQANAQLDQPGQVMLRNCYFEIAHCHFLREQYEQAIAAYSSSAGRYQHEADSLTAYVQIANCYDRLRRPTEALSTLAQAQLILKQLPEQAFPTGASAMSRDDWQRWLDWAIRLHE